MNDNLQEVIRRIHTAFKTLQALPDNESKWVSGYKSNWPEFRNDYAATEKTKVIRFRPSARDVDDCLPVLSLITTYEQTGKTAKLHSAIMRAGSKKLSNWAIIQQLEGQGEDFGPVSRRTKERNFAKMKDAAYRGVYEFNKEFWDEIKDFSKTRRHA